MKRYVGPLLLVTLCLPSYLLLMPSFALSSTLTPTDFGTVRHLVDPGIGDRIILGTGQFLAVENFTNILNSFVDDHSVLEFDLRNATQSRVPVYFNFFLKNTDTHNGFLPPGPHYGFLSLYAYVGNGIREVSDFFRTDIFLTTFSDFGLDPPPNCFAEDRGKCFDSGFNMSIDVTQVYNTFIAEGHPFLGLEITEAALPPGLFARYFLSPLPFVSPLPMDRSFLFDTVPTCAPDLAAGTFCEATGFNAFIQYGATGLSTDLLQQPQLVIVPVPEPSTWLLLGSGLVGMILWRKRTA